jgi:endonuclease YncB( thermonuclease family)
LVTYKQREGKTHLNYIRNEIQFKCDWKRRLFSTNYAIVAETVITGGTTVNAERIQNKLAFRDSQSLSDKVQDFYDNSFWENYNIIEPEESLENAVSRLMKQHR